MYEYTTVAELITLILANDEAAIKEGWDRVQAANKIARTGLLTKEQYVSMNAHRNNIINALFTATDMFV